MLDIVIQGDQVVTPWGVGSYDIGIQGEKIVAVQSLGTLKGEVGRMIDARGKIVIPGGIEPHAHSRNSMFPQYSDAADINEISRACVWGGTTTVFDFAIQRSGMDIFQSIDEKRNQYRGKCDCDYAWHCMIIGSPSAPVIEQVGEAIRAGFPSIKVFTTSVRPPSGPKAVSFFVDMGHIAAIMEKVAAHGGILAVHGEDNEIVMYNHHKLQRENRIEFPNLPLVHSKMSEDLAFRRVIRVAEWTGSPVYFVHVSAKEGVEAIREARGKGLPVYGETLHNYVTFTAEDYKKPDGQKYQTYPSLKFDEDRSALWGGLLNGNISCMSTDEVSTPFEIKVKGKTIFDVAGGQNGVETRVGITYTEGVVKRGMSLRRFADVVSTNAAKILGLFPRKGAIAPGSDADIVFVDPQFAKKLTLDDLHEGDYSIWEGWEVNGWPVFTMIRGQIMVEDRKLVGRQGQGQLIPGRKIDPEILKGPM